MAPLMKCNDTHLHATIMQQNYICFENKLIMFFFSVIRSENERQDLTTLQSLQAKPVQLRAGPETLIQRGFPLCSSMSKQFI